MRDSLFFLHLDRRTLFPPFPLHIKSCDECVKRKELRRHERVYSINMAAAAPMMGASSLASAVGAMARPVEVEVRAEVVVKILVD